MPRRVFCWPRFTSFLIALCRYQLSLQHLAGSANLPSDFASRNTSDWNATLGVISFILETENSVVILSVFFSDIERMPSIYHSPSGPHGLVSKMSTLIYAASAPTWNKDCPSKTVTHIKDVIQYLNIATISNDGYSCNINNNCRPHWIDHGTMLHSWSPFKAPASNDGTAPDALDVITAITWESDSCHTCASKSSNIPSPSSHQMIHLKSWVCHFQPMSPSSLKECRTYFTASCILPDNKSYTSLWCPCQAGRRPTPLGWSHRSNTCWPCTWVCLANEHQCTKKPWFSHWSRPDWTVKKILLLYRQYLKTGLLCREPLGGHVAVLWLDVATVRLNSRLQLQGFRSWDLEAIQPADS